mmetsp:Transcript_36269/g.112821  ORF Transcript_36269/g.112821 Transcript_36269/m.112821 type:complete len:250 (+) Transcript_36269:1701-2450(+)
MLGLIGGVEQLHTAATSAAEAAVCPEHGMKGPALSEGAKCTTTAAASCAGKTSVATYDLEPGTRAAAKLHWTRRGSRRRRGRGRRPLAGARWLAPVLHILPLLLLQSCFGNRAPAKPRRCAVWRRPSHAMLECLGEVLRQALEGGKVADAPRAARELLRRAVAGIAAGVGCLLRAYHRDGPGSVAAAPLGLRAAGVQVEGQRCCGSLTHAGDPELAHDAAEDHINKALCSAIEVRGSLAGWRNCRPRHC